MVDIDKSNDYTINQISVPLLESKGIEKDEARVPENLGAEQILLGLLLIDNKAFDYVADSLMPHHFYDPLHNRLYGIIKKLISRGQLADSTTLRPYMENDEGLLKVGGMKYVQNLAFKAVPFVNVQDYARIVHNLSVQRDLMRIGVEIYNKARVSSLDLLPLDQITQAEQALYEVAEKGKYEGGFISFERAITESINMTESAYRRDGHISGISTGFKDLDDLLGGFQNSDLIIIAGRPGMGKTAFATNIAFHAAKNFKQERTDNNTQKVINGAIVGFFSVEMSSEQLATRILSEQAGISSQRLRRGNIKDEYANIVDVSRTIEDIPLYIDDTGGLSLSRLMTRARRLKRQHGLGLLIIDYLQLLSSETRRQSDGRVQEITQITTGLKALAKELDVPIIALSQLSRQVESRDDHRPQLSDLRESGSIEQDADVVMFIFREEYYLSRQEPTAGTEQHAKWQEKMEEVINIANIIVGKQRHGPTGVIQLHFTANMTRFSNLEKSN